MGDNPDATQSVEETAFLEASCRANKELDWDGRNAKLPGSMTCVSGGKSKRRRRRVLKGLMPEHDPAWEAKARRNDTMPDRQDLQCVHLNLNVMS